ncbi:MAG TPA: hypothetical protein VK901_06030 [Nitrospiraceae bacterium]|nr:hypothetical protein [Nitrospiraceae bacterium]
MTGTRQQYLIAVLMVAGTMSVWGASSWGDRGLAQQRETTPPQGGH